ncbi:SMI1/KNR4 family protein [Terribacillus saccharophilus]|uniref:SMI1/KNR4 family protein n=1 Tax=Terribacillus saccharophilus TaxID=361277 RepID=UPI003982C8AA
MRYTFLTENQGNSFYPVANRDIQAAENRLALTFPKELVLLYAEVGYGFIKGSEYNVNRIMDPYSVRDFRLRENDFVYYPDIEIYEAFENDKLIFFEGSESALFSIALNESACSPVYYYDLQIAESLEEFLRKMNTDDKYYMGMLEEL